MLRDLNVQVYSLSLFKPVADGAGCYPLRTPAAKLMSTLESDAPIVHKHTGQLASSLGNIGPSFARNKKTPLDIILMV